MSFEFQSMLHRTRSAMLDAIAYEFMTAGGQNSPEMVDGLLGDPAALAAECIEGWRLDRVALDFAPNDLDEPQRSHMEKNGYDTGDLSEAIAAFIATRPDRAAADEGDED